MQLEISGNVTLY